MAGFVFCMFNMFLYTVTILSIAYKTVFSVFGPKRVLMLRVCWALDCFCETLYAGTQ